MTGIPLAEVEQSLLNDFIANSTTFAKKNGGLGLAIGNGFDIHGRIFTTNKLKRKDICFSLHGNIIWLQKRYMLKQFSQLRGKVGTKLSELRINQTG